MKIVSKNIALITVVFIIMISTSGCWNYRDVNEVSIAAGLAIDKNPENNKYIVTAELLRPSGGKDIKMESSIISSEGSTLFEGIRNFIMKAGKRIYWSHAKVVVISWDIAQEGVVKILDFIERDAEMRADIWLLVSKEKTAREILEGKDTVHEAIAFHIDDQFKNEKSISKYPAVELYEFISNLSAEGISPVLPTASMVKTIKGEIVPDVHGTAVFRKDKMVGLLDAIETRSMLFVKNELKGGVITELNVTDESTDVTLEIGKSKTKLKPVIKDEELLMKIDVEIDATIGEINSNEDVIAEEGREKLIKKAQESIKKQIEDVIRKVQEEYKSDIFGFGSTIHQEMPALWEKIKTEWGDMFVSLDTEVNVKLNIKGSALTSKPIKIGD